MKLYDNDEYRETFMELVYRLLQSDGTNDRANLIIDAFDAAPEVEAEPLLPNDPLTMKELREMDGYPVWVVQPDNVLPPFWGIVNANDGTVLCYQYFAIFEDYDTEWLAYRRKPEEETT